MNKLAVSLFSVLGAVQVVSADPEVTNLSVTQDKAHVVKVTYTLSENAIVTFDITTNGVSIGADNYQSLRDANDATGEYPAAKIVKAGDHTLLWQPNREWPGHVFKNGEFAVVLKAWSLSNPPDYMVVSLTGGKNARTFYASVDEIPGGIKTADPADADAVAALVNDVYRTEKLVMRKIPAAANQWRMGSPTSETQWRSASENLHYVTLSEDFYIGIYELTNWQRNRIDSNGAWNVKPNTSTSYDNFRGSATGEDYCWPAKGHAVDPTKVLGKLRDRTGLEFDFPTEAQWEFACRAGTSGPFADGSSDGAAIGWGVDNANKVYQVVGLKQPNAWGLYDMHGNAQEWVLDQWGDLPTEPQLDPKGPTDNPGTRVNKSGSVMISLIVAERSASRRSCASSSASDSGYGGFMGVRLCCPATIPAE